MSINPSKSMAKEIAYALRSIGAVSVTKFFEGAALTLDGVQ